MSPPTQYYLKVFGQFPTAKFFLSWNWAAFLATLWGCGHVWLAYRRMYWAAAIWWVFHTIFLIILIHVVYPVAMGFSSISSPELITYICGKVFVLLMCNGMGMVANALYFNHVRYAIKHNSALKGTDTTAALIAIVSSMILWLLLKHSGIIQLTWLH